MNFLGWQINLAESHGLGQTDSVSKYKVERDRNGPGLELWYPETRVHTGTTAYACCCMCLYTHTSEYNKMLQKYGKKMY